MSEHSPLPPQQEAPAERLARLHAQGAQRFDPAGYAYLAALSQRQMAMPGGQDKLVRRLAEFEQRFTQALTAASALIEDSAGECAGERAGECTGESVGGCAEGGSAGWSEGERQALQQALDLGDCQGVQRLARRFRARRQPSPVASLHDALHAHQPPLAGQPEAQTLPSAPASSGTPPLPPRRELRALSELRAVQARLSIEKRIANAIAHPPANAGPMNAHRLVTRAVSTMQQISPDYLNRFVGYVDTLMALEQLARKS